jgi:hypothetical protein
MVLVQALGLFNKSRIGSRFRRKSGQEKSDRVSARFSPQLVVYAFTAFSAA